MAMVCVRSPRGSHLPPSFGISALTLLIAFCPLIFAGLSPCAPSVECRANILDWSVRHGPGFISRNLGLKRLTVELDAILPCTQPANRDAVPVVLVDVGAGIHGLQPQFINSAKRLHEDDSDSLWLLGSFGSRGHVHAFEANAIKANELRLAAATRSRTANFTAHYTVHTVGVGRTNGQTHVNECGPWNIWSIEANRRSSVRGCKQGAAIALTTMDAFLASLPLRTVPLYIKVDVEGGEWDVLAGMHSTLLSKRVALMSFEYAVFWHESFHSNRELSAAQRQNASNVSLYRFQKTLTGYGYDTYLINAGDATSGVVLVPVHGDFWHNDLEICFNRSHFYQKSHCWNDLLAVRQGDTCVREALFGNALRRTHESLGREVDAMRLGGATGHSVVAWMPPFAAHCNCLWGPTEHTSV